MPPLTRLFVVQTTADIDDAGTDAGFQLQIARPGGDVLMDFPDLEHDERERGRTDQYEFDLSGVAPPVNSDDPGFSIIMRMVSTEDGWLPSSIFVFGQTTAGTTIPLGSHPSWSFGAFDRGAGAGGLDAHVISGFSQ